MKKIFSSALFYKEWKNAKIMAVLLFSIILLFKTVPIMVNIPVSEDTISKVLNSQYGSFDLSNINEIDKQALNASTFINTIIFSSREIFDIMLMALIAILCFMQVFPDRWGKQESMTFSFPYEKGSIMLHKVIIGFSIIWGVFLINTAVISIEYFSSIDLLNTYVSYGDILKWFTRSAASYSAIYGLFMFVYSVCGNIFVGVLVGPLTMIYPIGIATLLSQFFDSFVRRNFITEKSSEILTNVHNSTWFNYLSSTVESLSLFNYSGKYSENQSYYTYSNIREIPVLESLWGMNIALLLSATITFGLLAIFFFQNGKLEQKNWFIQYKGFKNVFIPCFTIAFGLLGGLLLDNIIFGNSANKDALSLIAMTLISLISGLIISIRLTNLGRRKERRFLFLKRGAVMK